MKYLLLLLSFNVSAYEICSVSFTHDHRRINEELMQSYDFKYELWIEGGTEPLIVSYDGNARRFMWWEPDSCPPCSKLKARAVDNDGLYAGFTYTTCAPPTQPIICIN